MALFDFDGTIARTVEEGVRVFNRMARQYGFREITRENAELLRDKGPKEVMKELRVSMLKIPLVLGGLRNGVKRKIGGMTMPDGVRHALLELRKNGYALGIVTSNSKDNVLRFLKHNEIEVFDYVHAGSGIFSKARAIGKAVVRNNLKRVEVVYVGDEIRDIEAAQKNHIRAIGVTWGVNSRKGLEGAHADFVVDRPHELTDILL